MYLRKAVTNLFYLHHINLYSPQPDSWALQNKLWFSESSVELVEPLFDSS